MLETTAALQPLLIGGVILWSAAVKLLTQRGKIKAQSLALEKLVGKKHSALAYRGVGAGEAILGLALLTPPIFLLETYASIALGVGFIGYLAFSRIAAPDASCGCMGPANVPVTWRSFLRAGWILAAALLSIPAMDMWWTPFTTDLGLAIAVVLIEAALFVSLSPEFDGIWLVPLRRLKVRFTEPLGSGDPEDVPLASSIDFLHTTELFRHFAPYLKSDVREYWEEGEYRIICYLARADNRECTAVWAVPMYHLDMELVRVAFVDDETDEIVLRHQGTPESNTPRPDWALPASS